MTSEEQPVVVVRPQFGIKTLLNLTLFAACAAMMIRTKYIESQYLPRPKLVDIHGAYAFIEGDRERPCQVWGRELNDYRGGTKFYWSYDVWLPVSPSDPNHEATVMESDLYVCDEAEAAWNKKYHEHLVARYGARTLTGSGGSLTFYNNTFTSSPTMPAQEGVVYYAQRKSRRLYEHHVPFENGIEIGPDLFLMPGSSGHFTYYSDADTGEMIDSPGPGDTVIEVISPPTDVKPLSPDLYPQEDYG